MNNWFLIYCKPKQDTLAEINLIRQGFVVFRPTITVVKSKIGAKDYHSCESLFPRYLFIQVDPKVKSIAPVVSTFGVSGFVKFGDQYAIASEALINEIKVDIQKQSLLAKCANDLVAGDEIYINGHGFSHMKAIYCNPCGNERAMILMNILGKESRLSVPTQFLTKKHEFA
jgi:transcriptional antiterminator RfaH